ncbi:MAG: phage integrase N-terminal SAM-like domain-containing protein [Vulcanimicrobiota bacterium]
MFDEHLAALREDGFSPRTLEAATRWLHHFKNFCGNRSPVEFKAKDLEQWHKELIWTPGPKGKLYAENTVGQAVGAVRRFYRRLLAEGRLTEDPTATLVTPKPKKARPQGLRLKSRELREVFSRLDLESPFGIRDRAVLGMLVETGISAGACSRINVGHLCFDTGAVLTRGRTQKIHSLTDGLLADLHRYLREARPLLVTDITPALFLDRCGNRISTPSVRHIIDRARKLLDPA